MKILNWIKCKLGFHQDNGFVENFTGDTGIVLTLGWDQCERCGHSKIVFSFGS
jgi:hypothetical protein